MLAAIGVAIALCAPGCASDVSACLTLINSPELREPGPLFLTSFPEARDGPLHDTAFLYDNAVAIIALTGCGRPNQAARIGEAILLALDHDRYWTDGRIRNAYLTGPVKHHPLPLPGWWEPAQNKWVEDRYQVGSDTGNMAWAMLALLTLYEQDREPAYLSGAERIGRYVENAWSDVRPRGYEGGTFGHEPEPEPNRWKSTEHNTDLAAAFGRLARDSGDKHWAVLSKKAAAFVAAMWNSKCHCFAVGTGDDGHTRNRILALDAQLWPLLAIPDGATRFPGALATAQERLRHGDGFAYSEAGTGIWTEGTAQAGLLMGLSQPTDDQTALASVIARNRTADGSYYASDGPSLPTGFQLQTDPTKPREYYHTPHLAALAWVALLQMRFNPFTGTSTLPGTSQIRN
ncbi:hypothetical protein [Rhizomicrobium electricum]|uniref:hypothetical protein n=1 Tax=Rhizomicrobium electricum TaxID=480070 RepID=UPI0031D6FFB7